ncbi:MAG: hypothetical protein BMS9Abin36_1764 [Gammaproteobacteria bacterium]|nr:MAG: hypothetical protein BMS9Abin36_1764 [Gammaproteobacteria bacterium]
MTESDITIRPLEQDDIDAIMRLHRELGWNPAFQSDGTTLRQRLTALTSEENTLLRVAVLDNKVMGYIHGEIMAYLLFAGREMMITEVFVREKARGMGVGKALMAAMEIQAVENKCFRISVMNSRERESYKRGFYPSLSYEERNQTAFFSKRLDWG